MPPAEQTDAESFDVIEPQADAFRNYLPKKLSVRTEELMLDKRRAARPVGRPK
jgi:catalase-peroxidase